MKILGIALGVLIVAAAGVGAAVYLGYIPAFWLYESPERSARYYPEDTLAYAWLTLNPSADQRRQMTDIWDRLNEIPNVRDVIEEWQELLDDETGIDFDRHIAPWIGPAFSMAIMDVDDPSQAEDLSAVDAAATLGVRDESVAAIFLDKWLDYLRDENGADFDKDLHGDFDVWIDESGNGNGAYALSPDLMVFATNEDAMEDVLDRIAGDSERTLASRENFNTARAALPDRRFASIYIDLELAAELSEETDGWGGFDAGIFATPAWAAGSAGWLDRGIAFDAVSPADPSNLDIPAVANAAELLPAATMGFVALAFDPNVDNWRAELQDYPIADIIEQYGFDVDFINLWTAEFGSAPELTDDSTLADALDVALEIIDDFTGIHPEEELLDYLDGDLIMAVQPFDFGKVEDNPEENAVDAVAMLSYLPDNKSELEDSVEDIIDLIAEFLYLDIDDARVDVGADDDARVFAIDDTAYSPGYALHDGYLIIGAAPAALQAIIQAQHGEIETLSSNAEYNRAASRLLSSPQFVAYADINGIVSRIDRADLDISRDEYRALEKSLSAVAMSAEYGGDRNRFNLVLTLFPED